MEVNEDRLNSFMGKMLGDVGAAMNASLMLLGDKLGLYRALAQNGPMDPAALARTTGTTERYIREWLSAQAASGYVEYDSASGKFSMLPEQTMALADEDSPVFLGPSEAWSRRPSWMSRRFPKRSRPARVSVGTSAATACFAERRVSSGPVTSITWSSNGYPRLTGSSTG